MLIINIISTILILLLIITISLKDYNGYKDITNLEANSVLKKDVKCSCRNSSGYFQFKALLAKKEKKKNKIHTSEAQKPLPLEGLQISTY